MNSKFLILLLLVLCFAVNVSGLCASEDQKTELTVKKIAFTRDKGGSERITLFCNQSCVPELFSLEEENPRVVMDMKGFSLIPTKARNVNTGGKLVKRVRSYLDKQTKILRVVLDMEPSKYYNVRPTQDPSGNTYVLTINEDISLSEQNSEGSKDTKGSPMSQETRITILRPDLSPGEQEGKLQEATPSQEKRIDVTTVKDLQLVDQGRSQLNAGEFAAAVNTFTQILAAHPQDSLSYRLRGNAYDNLGDRQKAVEDWIQAARLGDTILHSYLDFLQVKWRENPAPSHPKGVKIIGNRDSKRYHLPGMKYYDLVKAYHRVVFQSEKEAIRAGYHRARE
jgi:tetratricopeptide (TPR) repeat protein